jgi:hypothetical protein
VGSKGFQNLELLGTIGCKIGGLTTAKSKQKHIQKMGLAKQIFRYTLLVIPLGIFFRTSMCKLNFPILGCDGPACPVIRGDTSANCSPTGNTAELREVCGTWASHFNDHLSKFDLPATFKCTAQDDYLFLRTLGTFVFFFKKKFKFSGDSFAFACDNNLFASFSLFGLLKFHRCYPTGCLLYALVLPSPWFPDSRNHDDWSH